MAWHRLRRWALAAALPWAAVAPASMAASPPGQATPAQAVALVREGVQFIRTQGASQGYAAITDRRGRFVVGDLYLVVYGLDGVVRAHGANARLVGRNLSELKDVDGKAFVRERIALARDKTAFWQDYKFTNPVTRAIEPKAMYCERLEDSVVCGGVYR